MNESSTFHIAMHCSPYRFVCRFDTKDVFSICTITIIQKPTNQYTINVLIVDTDLHEKKCLFCSKYKHRERLLHISIVCFHSKWICMQCARIQLNSVRQTGKKENHRWNEWLLFFVLLLLYGSIYVYYSHCVALSHSYIGSTVKQKPFSILYRNTHTHTPFLSKRIHN